MLTKDKHADIMLIYRWFSSEMKQARRNIQFPKGTDPTKTYLYKDLNTFYEKVVQEMSLPDDAVRKIIKMAVENAKTRNILNRGAKLLHIKNILEVCKTGLEMEEFFQDNMLKSIEGSKAYLDKNKLNSVFALSSPSRIGGLSNLTQVVEGGMISKEYLALSRTTMKALLKIPLRERARLPSDGELMTKRMKILIHLDRASKIQEIMGSDLYLIPLRLE